MKNIAWIIALLPILLTTATYAAQPPAQNDGNNNGAITILGNVQGINNHHEFVLQSPDGSFNVQMTTNQSLNLQQGEAVVVSGTLQNGYGLPVIKATTVRSKRDRGAALNKALKSLPNSTTNLSTAHKIRPRPPQQIGATSDTLTNHDNNGIQLRTTNSQPQRVDTNDVTDNYSLQNNQLNTLTGSVKNDTNYPGTIPDNNISKLVAEPLP